MHLLTLQSETQKWQNEVTHCWHNTTLCSHYYNTCLPSHNMILHCVQSVLMKFRVQASGTSFSQNGILGEAGACGHHGYLMETCHVAVGQTLVYLWHWMVLLWFITRHKNKRIITFQKHFVICTSTISSTSSNNARNTSSSNSSISSPAWLDLFSLSDFLREDTPVGTSFLRAAAHDDDQGSNSAITYSLSNQKPAYLHINPSTGWIYVNHPISQVRDTPNIALLLLYLWGPSLALNPNFDFGPLKKCRLD